MKIRIAKKKLKKVISEAYRINKKHIKLMRTYFVFNSDYGYCYCDGSIGLYSIKIQKKKIKKKPMTITKRHLLRLMKEMFVADVKEYIPKTETMEKTYKQPPRTRRYCKIYGNVNNSK